MSTPYRIQDEPRPGTLAHFTVNPTFPLLAMMLAGTWLGLPWFIFNAFALGSTTRFKELALALMLLPGTLLLYLLLGNLLVMGVLTDQSGPYAGVLLTVWKVALAYVLFDMQQRSFALHEYYGGPVRNGALVLMAAFVLSTSFLPKIVGKSTLLWVLLG